MHIHTSKAHNSNPVNVDNFQVSGGWTPQSVLFFGQTHFFPDHTTAFTVTQPNFQNLHKDLYFLG